MAGFSEGFSRGFGLVDKVMAREQELEQQQKLLDENKRQYDETIKERKALRRGTEKFQTASLMEQTRRSKVMEGLSQRTLEEVQIKKVQIEAANQRLNKANSEWRHNFVNEKFNSDNRHWDEAQKEKVRVATANINILKNRLSARKEIAANELKLGRDKLEQMGELAREREAGITKRFGLSEKGLTTRQATAINSKEYMQGVHLEFQKEENEARNELTDRSLDLQENYQDETLDLRGDELSLKRTISVLQSRRARGLNDAQIDQIETYTELAVKKFGWSKEVAEKAATAQVAQQLLDGRDMALREEKGEVDSYVMLERLGISRAQYETTRRQAQLEGDIRLAVARANIGHTDALARYLGTQNQALTNSTVFTEIDNRRAVDNVALDGIINVRPNGAFDSLNIRSGSGGLDDLATLQRTTNIDLPSILNDPAGYKADLAILNDPGQIGQAGWLKAFNRQRGSELLKSQGQRVQGSTMAFAPEYDANGAMIGQKQIDVQGFSVIDAELVGIMPAKGLSARQTDGGEIRAEGPSQVTDVFEEGTGDRRPGWKDVYQKNANEKARQSGEELPFPGIAPKSGSEPLAGIPIIRTTVVGPGGAHYSYEAPATKTRQANAKGDPVNIVTIGDMAQKNGEFEELRDKALRDPSLMAKLELTSAGQGVISRHAIRSNPAADLRLKRLNIKSAEIQMKSALSEAIQKTDATNSKEGMQALKGWFVYSDKRNDTPILHMEDAAEFVTSLANVSVGLRKMGLQSNWDSMNTVERGIYVQAFHAAKNRIKRDGSSYNAGDLLDEWVLGIKKAFEGQQSGLYGATSKGY
jgi:hypothetical protein